MTVIPFPVVLPRTVLQPSLHARGARPYIFEGRIDDWHAPGCQTGKVAAITKSAIDSAWLVQHVLGNPTNFPSQWPGVPPVLYDRLPEVSAHFNLRGYQTDGARFLAERDWAMLTDYMGLGKTRQALAAAELRLSLAANAGLDVPGVLILCPALAKRMWQDEIRKLLGLEAAVLDSLRPGALPQTRYVICNYDILEGARRRDQTGKAHAVDHLPGWSKTLTGVFPIVIGDEWHIVAGRGSRRTAAVRNLCRKAVVVWGLTGTPIKNYVRDLWAQIDVLSDGLFGNYWDFARRYCDAYQAQYGMVDKGQSNLDELGKRLQFFMLGRTQESVKLELPEMQREVYRVDVKVTAPSVHHATEALAKAAWVGKALRATALAKRSAVVAHAVEALQNGQKVVVYLYMREQAEAVAKDIQSKVDARMFAVHGELTSEARYKQAENFRDCQAPAAFVATVDSVGIAISLVGADLVLFGDLVPEPWKLLQAEKRAHRIGSTKPVLIRYLVATGTLDEGVCESVIDKLDAISKALGDTATDDGAMAFALGKRSDESIIDGLFARLKAGK